MTIKQTTTSVYVLAGILFCARVGFLDQTKIGAVASEAGQSGKWTSLREYREHVWKLPQALGTSLYTITLKCNLPRDHHGLSIGLDHAWLKNGLYAEPHEPGAVRSGLLSAGIIHPGEVRSFNVAAGRHEISVGDDFYSSETMSIEISPGGTKEFICGERFNGSTRTYYEVYYLFKNEKSGKNFYFLREVCSPDTR